jgi:bifunctional DNA-binding transcriptional regulator/antitoxin component of YhaV-PrlF toxin-antitoxin module
MREEYTVAEVYNRGRLQLPLPLRKALKIESGGLVRVTVSVIEMDEDKSDSSENPHEALTTA